MASLLLLAGEKEELVLRPTAAGLWPRYALALLPMLGAVALFGIARSPSWVPAAAPGWQLWRHLWGTDPAAHLLVALCACLAAAASYAARRSLVRAAAILLVPIAASAVALASGLPMPWGLPAGLAAVSLLLAGLVEAARRGTRYHVTNVRTVERRSFPRHVQLQVRHDALRDLDARQGWLGRLLDTGDLHPVAGDGEPAPTLRAVHPYARVRRMLELLVRRATVNDYLRQELELDGQVGAAVAALQRR
jgi:hypothetical protein